MESLSDFFDAYHPVDDAHLEAALAGKNQVLVPPAFNINVKLMVSLPPQMPCLVCEQNRGLSHGVALSVFRVIGTPSFGKEHTRTDCLPHPSPRRSCITANRTGAAPVSNTDSMLRYRR